VHRRLPQGWHVLRCINVQRVLPGRKVPQSSGKAHAALKEKLILGCKQRAEGCESAIHSMATRSRCTTRRAAFCEWKPPSFDPRISRVYRAKEGEPKGPKSWRILRKGVSDMYRRAQVCRAANQRYLEALASVSGSSSLLQEAAEVCAPLSECFGSERSRFTPSPQPWRVRPQWHPQRRPARFKRPPNHHRLTGACYADVDQLTKMAA